MIGPIQSKTASLPVIVPQVGSLQGRKVIPFTSMFKTWQIIVCAITVIGLFVLLGLYLISKKDHKIVSLPHTPDPVLVSKKEEILKDNPLWEKAVKQWHGFSIEHEVWLLQLFELRQSGISIQILEGLGLNPDKKNIPTDKDILQNLINWKKPIDVSLKAIKELKIKSKKCPDAICLLQNLELLEMTGEETDLLPPPNISQNQNLKTLRIHVPLSALPDITQNINLTEFSFGMQKFSTPPDVSKNVNLTDLSLGSGKYKVAPDLSKNLKLERFAYCNDYPVYLDFTSNINLKYVFIYNSNLIDISDLKPNKKLEVFTAHLNNWSPKARKQFLELGQALPNARIVF